MTRKSSGVFSALGGPEALVPSVGGSTGPRQGVHPPPPRVEILWAVRKGDREARALVRQHPLGRELVVMVGQDIGWSRVYRLDEDRQALDTMAVGCLQDFLRLDWQRVV